MYLFHENHGFAKILFVLLSCNLMLLKILNSDLTHFKNSPYPFFFFPT